MLLRMWITEEVCKARKVESL